MPFKPYPMPCVCVCVCVCREGGGGEGGREELCSVMVAFLAISKFLLFAVENLNT